MSDWADEKAVQILHLILSPRVTPEEAAKLLAATFRAVEATGAHRGVLAVDEGLKKAFAK